VYLENKKEDDMKKRILKKKLHQRPLITDNFPFHPFDDEGYVSILDLTIPQVKEHIRNHPEEWDIEEFGVNGKIKKGLRIEVIFLENEMHIELYKNRRLVGEANFFQIKNIFIEEKQLKYEDNYIKRSN
jgi:hypothetical protein